MDIDDIGVPSNNGFDPEFAAAADWAKLYRSVGVQIVPCKNKVPRLKSWKEYQHELVPDAQFDRWYGLNGEFRNSFDMGALTGLASGRMLMIDLDVYKSEAARRWWDGVLDVHNNGIEPETWKQITGGGGVQMFFTYPPNWKFSVNAKTDLDVDIRCQGGFAVLPPTKHASGKTYAWVDGASPWEIDIALAPDWLLAEVERLIREHGGGTQTHANSTQMGADGTQTTASASSASFDAFGHQTDGRESFMRDLVWGAVIDWHRECPIKPSGAESVARMMDKYQVYEDQVSPRVYEAMLSKGQMLDREGRGPAVFSSKWSRAMDLWDTKVAEEARKPGKDYGQNQTKTGEGFVHTPTGPLPYPVLTIDDIMDRPDPVWAIDGLISERTLGFIFGPPSSLKTFIAIDIALSIVTKAATWWGRPIKATGAVVYLCREGTRSLKFRIKAWEAHRKAAARGMPFRLVEHPTNFMLQADVDRVIATIRSVADDTGMPIAALFVDTVSRVLPGAEENLQRDMTLFTGACEQIQLAFDCLVIGVHHTNKNGGIRGSTVIPGAGDFLLNTKRETGQMVGSVFVEKVKDGTDGYEIPFKATKIEGLGGIVPQSSLVVDGLEAGAAAEAAGRYEGGATDGVKRRDILQALHEAWEAKQPWGVKEAVEIVMVRWRLKKADATQLLLDWRGYQVIEYVVYNTSTKAKGYRKCKDI